MTGAHARRRVERAQQANHVLTPYANATNLEGPIRTANSECYRIQYARAGKNIVLEEDLALSGERHILSLNAVTYLVETGRNEVKEIGVHRHPRPGTPHNQPHLQFKIQATGNRVIRIPLEHLTWDDYARCIKGFLHIANDLLGKEGVAGFFFNERVAELEGERRFLLERIRSAERQQLLFGEDDTPLGREELAILRADERLLPFFHDG